MEHAGVGDEHQLELVELMLLPHLGAEAYHVGEVRVGGRLAVAAQGDVVEPAQGLGRVAKRRLGEDPPGDDQVDHAVQLVAQAGAGRRTAFRLAPPRLTWQ